MRAVVVQQAATDWIKVQRSHRESAGELSQGSVCAAMRATAPAVGLLLWLQLSIGLASESAVAAAAAALQLQTCVDGFVVHRDKIIRTADSLKLGAEYLSNYEVASKVQCIKWCCDTDRCDVFVYEDRRLANCYLFHCGPPHDFKCKFTNHANYSSAVLTNYNLQSADAIDELNSLRKSSEPVTSVAPSTSSSSSTTTSSSSTTSTTTTTTSTTSSPPSSSSSSSEAVKLTSCSRNQFECRSSDDCIAIYNVCDGIPQCADGSDEALELGCPQERTSPAPPAQLQQQPAIAGYQQMMQHQQLPPARRLYPPEGPALANQEAVSGWPNYQPRGYVAARPPPLPQQQQQQQQPQPPNEPAGQLGNEAAQRAQLLPPNYGQWQLGAAAGPAGPRWPLQGISLDEHPSHASAAFQAAAQQQMGRAFEHKPAAVRLEELEAASGLYGQDLSRGYAPYYPAAIRRPESSSWQESNADNLTPPREGQQQQQQQQPSIRVALATVAPIVPYQQPRMDQQQQQQQQQQIQHSTTSTTPPPCDQSSENKRADGAGLQMPQPRSNGQSKASAEHASQAADDHKGHEVELKTVAEAAAAHLQEEHKSIAIAEHLARAGHASPRIDELDVARPKGAVVSLALGLSVTAIMAVLIACRMRVVKRRGRGRSHDSYAHDTDYLVNGMYL